MNDLRIARHAAAFAALTLASSFALYAQDSGASPQASTPAVSFAMPAPVFHLAALSADPSDLISSSASSSASISSDSDSASAPADPVEAARMNLTEEGLQPPPRRTYGRPRYNDNSHNPDGSNKYTFEAGIGFTGPIGNTYHYLNTNYAYQIGFGRNFNKKFGVLLQFNWDEFGFNGRTLQQQSELYDPTGAVGLLGNLDGNSHIYSFTLNPTYTFFQGDKFGGYGVIGAGFYHKRANFTTLEEGYEDFGGILIQVAGQALIDDYDSNAVGFNAGFGLTYKPSKFANEHLFAEVRYVFIDNSQRTGLTINNANTTYAPSGESYTGYDYYPANSNKTTYFPIEAGIRF
jgi:opacity protein-like surface antigen